MSFITKLKVLEAFAGVGSQRMALRNLGIEHEVVAISEIDKFAIQSYEAIHGETHNIGDIAKVKVEDIPDHDLFTYSFPCQDISVAGQGKGFSEDSDTRSSLLWECRKVIKGKKPKYLLMENVKNLVSKKFKPDFMKWLAWLETQGYTNYYDVLNAKDYGIPQNRERVFAVSILGEHEPYSFPAAIGLETRLKDVLEEEVDEKFYLSEEQTSKLIIKDEVPDGDLKQVANHKNFRTNTRTFDPSGISGTLDTAGGGGREVHVSEEHNPVRMNRNEVKGDSEIATALLARDYKGFGNQDMNGVKVKIINATKKGYLEAEDGDGIDLERVEQNTRRGRVQKDIIQTLDTAGGNSKGVLIGASRGREKDGAYQQELEMNEEGTSNTLTSVQKDNYVVEPTLLDDQGRLTKEVTPKELSPTLRAKVNGNQPKVYYGEQFRIRKLTPLECWRLMGFTDEDFYKAESVCSNSQLYKQAGNSIVVDVLEGIFGSMFNVDMKFEKKPIEIQQTLF